MITQYDWKFSEVSNKRIDATNGWYYWYIDWKSVNISQLNSASERLEVIQRIISFYTEHFLSSTLKNSEQQFGLEYNNIQFKINLRETFSKEERHLKVISESSDQFMTWLELLTLLKIPIYFGMSTTLEARLGQHIKSLSEGKGSNEDFGRRFIQRMEEMKLRKILLPMNLRVVILTIQNSETSAIERLTNIILKPINGIK